MQSDRAVELARTHLWKGRLRRSVVPRWTGLPGSLGHRTVPIALRVPRFAVVLGPRAGMVFDDRPPVGDVRLEHRLGRLDHLRAGVARRRRAAGRASLDQCAAGEVRREPAEATSVARRVAARRRVPPSHAADGPPFGPDPGRPDTVAAPGPAGPTPVPAPAPDLLAGPPRERRGEPYETPGRTGSRRRDPPGGRRVRPPGVWSAWGAAR